MSRSPDIVIVGAGISGCAGAYELARAGYRVEVIDRYGPAAMASGWTLAGVRQSGRDPRELPLAQRAVTRWQQWSEELGQDTGYRQHGNLRLARTPAEVERIRRLVVDQSAAGLGLSLLDLSQARELVPGLSDEVLAASHCPSDGHADPQATIAALQTAAERFGARFGSGERVKRVELSGGRVSAVVTDRRRLACGRCVLTPGVAVNDLLTPLGLPAIPLRYPVVTVLQTTPLEPLLKPVLGVAGADMAARQQLDGRLRVTGGAEASACSWHDRLEERTDGGRVQPIVRPAAAGLAAVIEKVSAVLPAFAGAPVARVWAGLLDLSPDALPVIDRAPGVEGLVVAAGFSGHGFGIGPVTGELLRDLSLDRLPELDVGAFRFGRWRAGDVEPAPLSLHG